MISPHTTLYTKRLFAAAVALLFTTFGAPSHAESITSQKAPQNFASPEAAVKALVSATQAADQTALKVIFGSELTGLLSGDAKQDALEYASFSKSVAEYSLLVSKEEDRYVLNLGNQNWPFPIPIVKRGGNWIFDTASGREEIINRRVGEGELTAIGVCKTYLTAQREYASEDRGSDGVLKYAEKIRSTAGQKDGLYWPTELGEELSPFGQLIADVRSEGYGGKTAEGTPQPYHGYRFKILTQQGSHAAGGAYNYKINGNLIGGFALVAYPAHWNESGVMTFIVNQWGKVYQRNLGPDSAELGAALSSFDPDPEWTLVSQQEEQTLKSLSSK